MARRSEHVYGPFKHGNRWRLVFVDGDGGRSAQSFASEGECLAEIDRLRAQLTGTQVNAAIEEYLADCRERGLREGTITTERHRLHAVFRVDAKKGRTGGLIKDVTPSRAAALSEAYRRHLARRQEQLGRGNKPSVDTRKGALVACRRFCGWCITRGYLRADPFAACKVLGKKKRGKKQLREDEGRAFFATAVELAERGDRSAVAALLYLVLGCRAREVTDRVARDIDARGTVLVIDEGKTDAAARRLAIPTVLQPLVKSLLVRDGHRLRPAEYLFDRGDGLPPTKDWALYHVKRICTLAKVPEVCTHSLRGLQSTLATAAHATGELVAAQLGQTGPAVTRAHYLAAGVEQSARGARALTVLSGGRS